MPGIFEYLHCCLAVGDGLVLKRNEAVPYGQFAAGRSLRLVTQHEPVEIPLPVVTVVDLSRLEYFSYPHRRARVGDQYGRIGGELSAKK